MTNPLLSDSAAPAPGAAAPAGAAASPAPGESAAPASSSAPAAVGAAAAAPVAPETGAPAGQAAGAPGSPSDWKPDGLPEHFVGKDAKETIEKMMTSLAGYRERDARRGEVPDKPDGYEFRPSEAVAPYLGDMANDPMFGEARALAHKHGISKTQFQGFLDGVFSKMIADGLVEAPYSAEAERAALAPEATDPKERATRAEGMAREALGFVDALRGQGLDAASADWLTSQMDRAGPIRAMLFIAGKMQAGGLRPAVGGQPAGAVTDADLKARTADPRNNIGSPTYDPAYAAETDRLYRQHYGAGSRA